MDNSIKFVNLDEINTERLTQLDINLTKLSEVLFWEKIDPTFLKELLIDSNNYNYRWVFMNWVDYIIQTAKKENIRTKNAIKNLKNKAKKLLLKNIKKWYREDFSEKVGIASDIVNKNNIMDKKFQTLMLENILRTYINQYLQNIYEKKQNNIDIDNLKFYLYQLENSQNKELKTLWRELKKQLDIQTEKSILWKFKIIWDDKVRIRYIDGNEEFSTWKLLYNKIKEQENTFFKNIKEITSRYSSIVIGDNWKIWDFYHVGNKNIFKKQPEKYN